MKSLKTNTPAVAVTSATAVSAADAMRSFVAAAIGAKSAALAMVCAAAAYLMNVHYLRDSKDPEWLAKSKAIDAMRSQVDEHTDIKSDMLNVYVARAEELADKAEKKLRPLLSSEKCKTADQATKAVLDYLSANGVESLNALTRKFGKSTGHDKASTSTPAVQMQDRVQSAIKSAAALAAKENVKGGAAIVNKAIAQQVSDPLSLAREAVVRASQIDNVDVTKFMDLVVLINKTIDLINARADKAEKPATRAETRKAAKAAAVAATA